MEEKTNNNEKEDLKNQKKEENETIKEEKKVETENNSELDELTDRYKRLLAEFENYKKRSQKERENLYNMITGDVVSSILPVMDNLEKAADVKTEDTSYQDGVKLVVKQLSEVLKKFGMEEIETVGKRFDPELHDAVSHVEDKEKGEQEIVEEYRKGYKIGNKVIRHSMVIVAN
ncbi:MAG: nucleotide exchange factor GrpE [Candidatus Scatovivens sp.]